jgi:hypothetical protein
MKGLMRSAPNLLKFSDAPLDMPGKWICFGSFRGDQLHGFIGGVSLANQD